MLLTYYIDNIDKDFLFKLTRNKSENSVLQGLLYKGG